MSMTQSRAVAAPSTSATSRTQAETQPPPTRIQFPTRQRDEMPWFGPTLSFPFQLLLWCRSRPHRPPQPAAADAAVAAVAASSSSRGWTESENHRVYDHVTSILSLSLPSKHNQHHPSSSQSIPHYQQQSVGVFSPKIPSRHCTESQTASTSRTKEITRNRHSHHKCGYNLDKTSLNCRFVASRQTNWVPGVVACKWKPKKRPNSGKKKAKSKMSTTRLTWLTCNQLIRVGWRLNGSDRGGMWWPLAWYFPNWDFTMPTDDHATRQLITPPRPHYESTRKYWCWIRIFWNRNFVRNNSGYNLMSNLGSSHNFVSLIHTFETKQVPTSAITCRSFQLF